MIECKNISKTYRTGEKGEIKTHALKNVSFTINDGDFIAIMGPSGSGKSTLMNILGALDVPTEGQYIINGNDVSKLSEDELADIRRNDIGFVFQSFNLLPRTTLLRNVMMPLIYSEVEKEEREKRAKKVLKMVGIDTSHIYHKSNQISGGQMQRVAIARALINEPSIILADEPTGNLDTKTGELVLETFQELNEKKHKTIILITHERYVAEHADRIINIIDGELVEGDNAFKKRRAKLLHQHENN